MRAKCKYLLGIAGLGATSVAVALGSIGMSSASASASVSHGSARLLGPAVLGPKVTNLWTSSNWSGYAIGTKQTPKGTYAAVSARWKVPVLKSNTGTKYSSQWIGIDGFTNTHLIQTGTEVDSLGGHGFYAVWWEILPAPETRIHETVKPGDTITASIVKNNAGSWTIKISNGTWTFTKTTGYSGPAQSVEWIVEAPQVGGSITSIAHTGRVIFTGITVNGQKAKLVASEGGQLKQHGKVKETPSVPSTIGDAFAMQYGKKAPNPPKS